MTTLPKISLALISGLLVSTVANAQGGPPPFSELDLDGNGWLSKEEVSELYDMAAGFGVDLGSSADAFFARLDTDENGEVSEEELENREPPE